MHFLLLKNIDSLKAYFGKNLRNTRVGLLYSLNKKTLRANEAKV